MCQDNPERRIAFGRLVSTICSRLAQADAKSLDASLNRSLGEIGAFIAADHAHFYLFRNANTRLEAIHTWRAEKRIGAIDLAPVLPRLSAVLQQGDPLLIPALDKLPAELASDRQYFEEQGFQAILLSPLKSAGHLVGFLGFYALKSRQAWADDAQMLIPFVADTMAGALQRIRTEEALHESALKYRQLFELSPIGIVVLDPETTRPLDFNETAHRQLGYTREAFAQLTLADIDIVESPEETAAHIARVMRGERDTFETKHRTRTGEIRDVHVTAQYLKLDGHTIYHCLWRDITERKKSEGALKEGEVNFQRFIESMTDIMVVASPKGRILYTNHAAQEKLGYTKEELTAMHLGDLHQPDDRHEVETILAAIHQEELGHCPLPLMTKAGSMLPVETRVWFGQWNGQACIFGVCKDLSEQQETQQRFERIFRGNPSPMALSSVPERRFLDVNEAFLKTTGYTREEIVGKTSAELGLIVSSEAQAAVASLILDQGRITNYELQVRRKDGALRDGLFTGEIIRIQGRECFLTVMLDITERKQARAQVRLQSLMLNQIQDRVTITDLDGVITYINEAEVKALGYSREELIGASTEKYGEDPERGATQRQIVEQTLAQGEWRGEVVNQSVTGEEVILDCRTQVVFDEHGKKIALAGIATDITERKAMEAALREREQRLSLALETAQLGYWKWTVATNRVEWFGNHHRLYGIRHEDFEGTLDHVQRCVHPEDRQRGIDTIQRAVETHTPFNNTYRVLHPDGALRWLNSFGHIQYTDNGEAESMFGITRDISEYKFAQEEAEERVAQLTALLESMQCGVLFENRDRQVLFANQDFCDVFRLRAPDAFLGKDFREVLQAAAPLFAAPQRFLEAIESCITETRPILNAGLEMADGRILEMSYAPVSMADRQFGHLWICEDKTEQARYAREIVRAKEEWENTFDAVPDMICMLDKQHHIVRANRAFAERMGSSAEALVGQPCYECVHRLPQPPAYCPLTRTLKDHQEHTAEFREPCLGIDVLVTTTPLIDDTGAFIGSVHVARDVTERNETEARLRILGRMIDLAPSSIVIHDTAGNFLFANQKTFAMHGYEEAEFLAINLHELDVPESEARLKERFQKIAETGEATFEVAHYRKDGSTFPLEVMAKQVEWGGIPAVLSIATDISERKLLEQERLEMERRIQHTQKLESMGVLAGGIAHDFNNLLMAILGYADLAMDDLPPFSPARSKIEQIETASRRAAELCAQMLAYSGKGHFVIEPFNLSALIAEMAHLLKTSISKKAALHLQTEKDLPLIEGDATQVRQVIMNLVINASEALGEESGVISVSTGGCQCQPEDLEEAYYNGAQAAGGYVFLEVTDTGCGMDQATLDRLFEPFFTTKFTGRGLGMSAVLGIVRGHKGILKVTSQPGEGATFRILFPPAAGCARVDSPAPTAARPQVSDAHILFVEDEAEVRALGQEMLQRIGFQVSTAADGREALTRYEHACGKIDLVMLDLTMPHMDGEETFRALKELDPAVKIVMASGYSNHEIEARLAGEGLLGFIQKPYTMAQLKECLYPLFKQ